MKVIEPGRSLEAAVPPSRKRWEEPVIVLERSLEVSAQGGPPGTNSAGAPNGFLGPLGTSGNKGTCGLT